jgi:hypothetical protein
MKEPVGEWHTHFETIVIQAGYKINKDGNQLIPMYKLGTNTAILKRIYITSNQKARVQQINDAYHQLKEIKAGTITPTPL